MWKTIQPFPASDFQEISTCGKTLWKTLWMECV